MHPPPYAYFFLLATKWWRAPKLQQKAHTTQYLEPSAKASCGHFTKANEWLIAKQQSPIQWVDSHASHMDKDLFWLSS